MAKTETFVLKHSEIKAGADAVREKMANEGYHDIMEATLALYNQRSKDGTQGVDMGLFEAPIVDFLLDTTLFTLTQPEVEARLPREVWRRSAIATDLGTKAATTEGNWKIFTALYLSHGGLPVQLLPVMGDADRHANLTGNVFREAAFLGGGALKLLKEHELFEGQNDIIKDSVSLPKKIGACFGPRMMAMYEKLGDPYILPDNLRLHAAKKKGATIGFSKMASLLLEQLRQPDPANPKEITAGCPALRMPSPIHNNQTVLVDTWERLVDYLVPPDATANSAQGSHVPYNVYGVS